MKIRCEYKKIVPLKELKPHPKNRNKHGDDQIARLAQIFEYQGIRHPIIVSNLSGFIVAGHGRLAAATKLGYKEFPVDYQDFGGEEEEYAFLVSDNSIALWAELDLSGINSDLGDLGPDFDLDLLGIKNFTLDVADKEGLTDPDDVPEPPAEPKTKRGDIYKLGNHRLMCGDSTMIDDVEKLMDGEKADMVFTDPPYGMNVVKKKGMVHGVGIKGKCAPGVYEPVIGDDSIQTATDAITLCIGMGIKNLLFWGANFYASTLPNNSGWICWDKDNGQDFFADGELAWTNSDKQLRIFKHQWKGMIKASERGEKRVHPTQKPVALAEWCFEHYGKDAKKILDLFGGSGSTLLACEKTNRSAYLLEMSENYCDVIIARWEKFTGQKAELING